MTTHDLPVNESPMNALISGGDSAYAAWMPGSVATFTRARWNSDYRDIPIFESQEELDKHIDEWGSSVTHITEMSYVRQGVPIRINQPFSQMMQYNYVRVVNPAQPISGDSQTTWYYFITDIRHLAPNTTEIYVQLDVIQSFIYSSQFRFGRCYIERGHIGIANQNQLADYGRRFLTVPEGFDLGGEYKIEYIAQFMAGRAVESSNPNSGYQILILSTVDLSKSGGTANNPELETATGNFPQNLVSGATLYVAEDAAAFKAMLTRYAEKPWITQGIIGVWFFPAAYPIPSESAEIYTNARIREVGAGGSKPVNHVLSELENWRDKPWTNPQQRYRHLHKFKTFPYSFWELTTYTGTPIILKPESWQDDDATVIALPHHTPPTMRIAYVPKDYNKGGFGGDLMWSSGNAQFSVHGEFLDLATYIMDMPSVPIVNDSYLSFMASQRNAIAFAHQSADWSQERTLRGADVARSQATSSMNMASEMTGIGMNANTRQTAIQNQGDINSWGLGAAGSIVGGARGGPAGAGVGALSAMMNAGHLVNNVNVRNQSTALQNATMSSMNQAQLRNSAFSRDTNYEYASFAAKGDYQNAIAGINAKVQDAKMIQPTTSGQLGGDAFLLANYKWGYDLKYKRINENVQTMIGEFWLRYGYALNRYYAFGNEYGIKRLHCMTNFTYWKMQECVIRDAKMPEIYKQTIRGIFEKGVTVWRDPAMIGSESAVDTNDPLPGITLS